MHRRIRNDLRDCRLHLDGSSNFVMHQRLGIASQLFFRSVDFFEHLFTLTRRCVR